MLLDDCLSAVDTQTANWIVERCIKGELMRARTCILVTHNVELTVKHAKFIAVLKDGRVVAKGTPEEIEIEGVMDDWRSINRRDKDSRSSKADNVESEEILTDEITSLMPNTKRSSNSESKATGAIKSDLFMLYFRASGRWYFWVAMCLMFFANQFSTLSIDFWIRDWAKSYREKESAIYLDPGSTANLSLHLQAPSAYSVKNAPHDSHGAEFQTATASKVNDQFFLRIYALLALIFALIKLLRMSLLFAGSLSPSRNLHTRLLSSISRASFPFYDATPIGQIVNRFSKDIEIIDQ